MRILYGVTGEGMGHAMRSRVVLEHLVARGHTVEIMASGRAHDFLKKRFSDVNSIHGFHLILDENRVRLGKTLWSNVLNGVLGVPKNISAYFDVIDELRPELVISDFESWTYFYAKAHGLPILSIDNMQIIPRCTIPDDIIEGHKVAFQLTKAFIKTKLPFCNAYFITSFFRPPIRKPDTRLFSPILRPEILAAKPTDGEHLLVYQSGSNEALERALERTGIECRIYGMRPGAKESERNGKLVFLPFSEAGFISDLASSRATIAGGGFTLMGEAVYLGKPMLAIPLEGQFEQILNSRYLEREGYGMFADDLDEPGVVPRFIERIDECARKLGTYTQDGNREILAAVDQFIASQ